MFPEGVCFPSFQWPATQQIKAARSQDNGHTGLEFLADFAVVIGKREAESGEVTLKNLKTGEQKSLELATAIAEVGAYGAR